MRLYVVRHGPAEDTSPSGRDFDRALTDSGRERVREVARRLRAEDEVPRVILTSPLVRALQTAEVIAAELDVQHVETTRELAPGGDSVALVKTLVNQKRKRAMLVGHQPDLTVLIEDVTGASFPTDMLKGMVVGLRANEEAKISLRFILDPKTLAVARHD